MNEILLWTVLVFQLLGISVIVAIVLRTTFIHRGERQEVQQQLRMGREESRGAAVELRKEVASGLNAGTQSLVSSLETANRAQQAQLENLGRQLRELIESNQAGLDRIRATLDGRVRELQESNEKKLDAMRRTVDEKLQNTLEKRLGESFKLVSERLEAVHKGLGDMQQLASGVGDLKRVLSNVKVRGTWAEVQLCTLLDQVLAPDQYAKNVAVKEGSTERVEFAVRLPGPKSDPGAVVWLPIDSKFPQEDYLRLQEAADSGDAAATRTAVDGLVRAVRAAAKDIHDKYVNPPQTTDFALLFLPTEGLYAEVLRQPALVEDLQQRFRVVLASPTTLFAILNSLRLGFQTLAIEQRAVEVWRVLGAVKTEFAKFSGVLEKVERQLNTASKTLSLTTTRTRALERRLRTVDQLPESDAAELLALETLRPEDDEEDAPPMA